MALFAAPLNSSHQLVVQVMEPVGGVVPHCALAERGVARRRTPDTARRTILAIEFMLPIIGITSAKIESRLEFETHRSRTATTLALLSSVCQDRSFLFWLNLANCQASQASNMGVVLTGRKKRLKPMG